MTGASLTRVPANPAESDQIQPAGQASRSKSNQVAPEIAEMAGFAAFLTPAGKPMAGESGPGAG